MSKSPKTTHPQTSKKLASKPKITKAKILFTVFVLAWTLLSTVASQYVVAFLMSIFLGAHLQEPFWTLIYYLFVYTLALVLIILVPPRLVQSYQGRRSRKTQQALDKISQDLTTTKSSLGVQRPPSFIDIGLAPVGYIAYIFAATALTALMQIFPWFDANQAQDVGFSYFITDLNRIFAMIATVFVAPVAEELIMRGWLYGKLRDHWKVPVAIILTSLLFAVLHGQWNVGVNVFVLSVILCGLREITGTVWSGILLHILSNGIAFYLLYVAI